MCALLALPEKTSSHTNAYKSITSQQNCRSNCPAISVVKQCLKYFAVCERETSAGIKFLFGYLQMSAASYFKKRNRKKDGALLHNPALSISLHSTILPAPSVEMGIAKHKIHVWDRFLSGKCPKSGRQGDFTPQPLKGIIFLYGQDDMG